MQSNSIIRAQFVTYRGELPVGFKAQDDAVDCGKIATQVNGRFLEFFVISIGHPQTNYFGNLWNLRTPFHIASMPSDDGAKKDGKLPRQ
jgi:hypothetical protein